MPLIEAECDDLDRPECNAGRRGGQRHVGAGPQVSQNESMYWRLPGWHCLRRCAKLHRSPLKVEGRAHQVKSTQLNSRDAEWRQHWGARCERQDARP